MNEAKENPRCAVHYHMFSDGRCSCPNTCDNCGITYVGGHSKDECLTVLKSRLKVTELAAKIEALSVGREPMSREKLIAAAKADLLANLPAPFAQPVERCTACNQTFDAHPEPGLCCHPNETFSTRWSPPIGEPLGSCFNEPDHAADNPAPPAMNSPNWVQKVSDDVDRQFATLPAWKQKLHAAIPSAPATAIATVFCRFGKDKNKHRGFFGGYCVDCGHPEPPARSVREVAKAAGFQPVGKEESDRRFDNATATSTRRVEPADALPPLDVSPEDYRKAEQLKNLQCLDADGLRRVYKELAASYYQRERQLAVSQAENKDLKHTVSELSAKVTKLSDQVLETRLAFILSDAILPEEFEPELPPTERLHAYIENQHDKMRQAVDKLGSGL